MNSKNTDTSIEYNPNLTDKSIFSILNSVQSRLTFLEKLLEGKLPVLEIPTDITRAKATKFEADSQTLELPPELIDDLQNIAGEEKVSLYCLLLTTFQILLYRYTNQTEIIVGTPVKDLKKTSFSNGFNVFQDIDLIPLQLDSESTFKDLVRTLEITLDARSHHKLSLNTELAKTLLENNQNHSLFQVLFEFQDTEEESESSVANNWSYLNLDLSLKIIYKPTEISCIFTYNSNLFNSSTIARTLKHFLVLLTNIIANPEQPIATLELLTPEEKQQILGSWNQTKTDYPQDCCIHHLVEQQVAKTPDAIAIVFEDRQLTYQQLNQRANSLAHYLQQQGVTSETLVGIAIERSLEMVVSILAIIKAGGAYVPLDPSYPIERIGYMLEDAKVAVLLTQKSLNLEPLQEQLSQQQTKIINLEQVAFVPEQIDNLTNTVAERNLAYVIYTSGSTGKPKGVQIEHRTAVNLLTAIARQPGITPKDTLLSVTTISFDIAVLEIFLPLITGAKLVVVSRQVAQDGRQLLQALTQSQATILQATPITWKMLLAAGWQGKKDLKILSGGEALSPELAQQLGDKGASVWNLYGPTEATIWSSAYRVRENEESISIGRPLANIRYYILDSNLMPLPVGIPGELYIGGECLARGYFNRPELTAERFIADPFRENPQARIYKTGDLACYTEDGRVTCLGRLDRQVKIRGFRIEVAEIESVILQYPGVSAVAVVVQTNDRCDRRLVGYIVNHIDAEVDPEALHQFLQKQLPTHMIPAGFMTIDALPLTLNGKVDPKALPPMDFVERAVAQNYVAPRNELESKLVGVWEKVLGVKPVGVKDDFRELGGNSLLTITLFQEIEATLQQQIPLDVLSNLTTVEHTARCFAEGQPAIEDITNTPDGISPKDYQTLMSIVAGRKGDRPRPNSLMVALQTQGSKPPFFFCANGYDEAAPLANYLGDRPFYLMESGYFSLKSTNVNIKALATHHLEDILTLQPQPPYLLAGYSTGGLVALEIARQLQAMGKEVAFLGILDTAGPHPVFQTYLKLNYMLRGNWNKFTASIAQARSSNSAENATSEIKASQTTRKPLGDLPTSDPYIIQPYQGKISLFLPERADRNFFFSHQLKFLICPRAGWDRTIAKQLVIERVPGDHFNMLAEPYVRGLAKKLIHFI